MMPTVLPNPWLPAPARPGPLWVRDSGEGAPLILLHGLGMTGEAFQFLSPRLAGSSRLIVPDLRGHGASAHLPGPYTTEAMAADLAPMLDALGLASAHLLGHSHGGAVAQAFARAHPERVRSLLLVSTYARQRVTWWQRLLGQMMPGVIACFGTGPMARVIHWLRPAGGGRQLGAQAAALAASMLAGHDRQCLGDTLRLSGRFDSRAWLNALQVPTLVIAGNADRVIVPRQAKDLARGIPGAHLQLLDAAGHALPLSHSRELSRLIAAWLDHVEGTATPWRVPEVA